MRTPCAVQGCEKPQKAKTYCLTHYTRWKRHGTPEIKPRHIRGQCTIPGCIRLHCARTYCEAHYRQWKRRQPQPREREVKRCCSIPECEKPHYAKTYCGAHYRLWKRYGTAKPETGYGKGHITRDGYRKICIDGEMVFEHRHIMGTILGRPLERSEVVHHKDHNRLNNVPENLEVLTHTIHMSRHHGRPKLPTTTITHRRCPQCGRIKKLAEFGTTSRRSYCLECWNAYYIAYRVLHPRDWSTFRREHV